MRLLGGLGLIRLGSRPARRLLLANKTLAVSSYVVFPSESYVVLFVLVGCTAYWDYVIILASSVNFYHMCLVFCEN